MGGVRDIHLGRLLVLLGLAALLMTACDYESPPNQPTEAIVDLTVSRTGAINLELKMGGDPSVDELIAIGHEAADDFGAVESRVAILNQGGDDFVTVNLSNAYERSPSPDVDVDFGPLVESLAERGYVDLFVRLSAPDVPMTMTSNPEPTSSTENTAYWDSSTGDRPGEVLIDMTPTPTDFWMLLAGVVVGLVAASVSVGILVARRTNDSARLRRASVWTTSVALAIAGLASLSLPFDQVDDLGVAGIASGSALTVANVVAASSLVLVVASLGLLTLSLAIQPPAPPRPLPPPQPLRPPRLVA